MRDDGELPEIGAALDDLDPDAWAWLPGVDYMTGWRETKNAADVLNAAFEAVGVRRVELRATAATGADGRGVVQLSGTPYGARELARVLASSGRGDPHGERGSDAA